MHGPDCPRSAGERAVMAALHPVDGLTLTEDNSLYMATYYGRVQTAGLLWW